MIQQRSILMIKDFILNLLEKLLLNDQTMVPYSSKKRVSGDLSFYLLLLYKSHFIHDHISQLGYYCVFYIYEYLLIKFVLITEVKPQ